jgi:hypothetical protein
LQDAENHKLERVETSGRIDRGQRDVEGKWLVEHPIEGLDAEAAMSLYGNSGKKTGKIM